MSESKNKTANIISGIGTGATVILLVLNFLLYRQISSQTTYIQRSADAAKKSADKSAEAVEQYKKSNETSSKSYELSKIALDSSIGANKKSLELQQKSIAAQIKNLVISDSNYISSKKFAEKSDSNYIKSINISLASLQAAMNNFQIENRAYIFLSSFHADSLKPNGRQHIYVDIKNFGKTPAFVLYVFRRFDIDTTIFFNRFKYAANDVQSINLFYAPGNDANIPINTRVVGPEIYDLVIKNKIMFYIHGEINFLDMATQHYTVHTFCFRVFPNGNFLPTPYHNAIVDLGDKMPTFTLK
jgi:hypothetical protein